MPLPRGLLGHGPRKRGPFLLGGFVEVRGALRLAQDGVGGEGDRGPHTPDTSVLVLFIFRV